MADFYAARSRTIPPLPWTNFAPPLSTLMISGIADKLYPLEGQAEAALRLRDARFVPVRGHHISPIDAADDVTEALRAFLLERIPT